MQVRAFHGQNLQIHIYAAGQAAVIFNDMTQVLLPAKLFIFKAHICDNP